MPLDSLRTSFARIIVHFVGSVSLNIRLDYHPGVGQLSLRLKFQIVCFMVYFSWLYLPAKAVFGEHA